MKRQVLSNMIVCFAAFAAAATGCWAEDTSPTAAAGDAVIAKPNLRTTAQKRGWLREQLRMGLRDRNQINVLQARINQLTPRQVNALSDAILAQQLPQDDRQQRLQEAQLQQLRAQALRQVLSDQLAWRRFNRVGYFPVITWLPEGTSFGASAVVSPDGRYVRVNANPMFSSVGPVYTYNLNTGETRPWWPQTGYPPYGNRPIGTPHQDSAYRMGQMPQRHLPPQPPSAYPKNVWHDGLRTRVGPRR